MHRGWFRVTRRWRDDNECDKGSGGVFDSAETHEEAICDFGRSDRGCARTLDFLLFRPHAALERGTSRSAALSGSGDPAHALVGARCAGGLAVCRSHHARRV